MVSRAIKFFAKSFPFVLLLSLSALANTCNNFATYTCASSTPNTVHILGQAPTNSSVGTVSGLITGNTFGVQMMGNGSAADILIVAAFTGSVGGSLNGQSFTSLSSFPEGAALGAISTTLAALGLGVSPSSFGYVDLHTPLANNGTLLVNVSGLPGGTAIYGMAVNPVTSCSHGKRPVCTTSNFITNITPNSEAGLMGATVPEPGTLSMLGTGLIGIAGLIRRRFIS